MIEQSSSFLGRNEERFAGNEGRVGEELERGKARGRKCPEGPENGIKNPGLVLDAKEMNGL